MGQVKQGPEGFLRTGTEREAAEKYARLFDESTDTTQDKLAHFAKYVRRQDMTRLLARYEIFKRVLKVKGSVVECGVFRGSGLMAWANFSAVLEPNNLTRRVYGFDTFDGFPEVGERDESKLRTPQKGELRSSCYGELIGLIEAYDMNRFLGHVKKMELIKGDASETIPAFIEKNPHLVVSLLFLDFDLCEPTEVAIEYIVPRMPRGAIIAFDELDNPAWPG
ncbi:TylF/MycF/NovP-related O-methyltransferase, partial [Planctomycetota bacterium]